MATKIQLTPAELQTQAKEMNDLKNEFASLFKGVTSELKNINSNWSPNLANNFSTKITSAQKTFENVVEMLANGATVANNCAVSFASVDSELSKIFNGAGEAAKTFWNEFVDRLKETPEHIKSIGELLDWLEDKYGKLPDKIKEYIKEACPDNLEEAYKLASDLLQGDLSMENVYSVIKYVVDDKSKSTVIIGTFKWYFKNYDRICEKDAKLQEAITREILEGDLEGALGEALAGTIDGVFGGTIDAAGFILGGLTDGFVDTVPFLNDFIRKYNNGESAGDYVANSFTDLADGLDWLTDGLAYGIDYISDAKIATLKKTYSWISGLF